MSGLASNARATSRSSSVSTVTFCEAEIKNAFFGDDSGVPKLLIFALDRGRRRKRALEDYLE
jgi:hypothetical protein